MLHLLLQCKMAAGRRRPCGGVPIDQIDNDRILNKDDREPSAALPV
jgi:hypothetical protein